MIKPKGIVFDMDGVLKNWWKSYF